MLICSASLSKKVLTEISFRDVPQNDLTLFAFGKSKSAFTESAVSSKGKTASVMPTFCAIELLAKNSFLSRTIFCLTFIRSWAISEEMIFISSLSVTAIKRSYVFSKRAS